jgi:hypothetical protein
MHGQVCREVRRHPCLKTPDDFVKCLDTFLKETTKRPHEKDRFAVKVERVRDWSAWLKPIKAHLTGVGGPSAPHSFEFVRREGTTRRACKQHTSGQSNLFMFVLGSEIADVGFQTTRSYRKHTRTSGLFAPRFQRLKSIQLRASCRERTLSTRRLTSGQRRKLLSNSCDTRDIDRVAHYRPVVESRSRVKID